VKKAQVTGKVEAMVQSI